MRVSLQCLVQEGAELVATLHAQDLLGLDCLRGIKHLDHINLYGLGFSTVVAEFFYVH